MVMIVVLSQVKVEENGNDNKGNAKKVVKIRTRKC